MIFALSPHRYRPLSFGRCRAQSNGGIQAHFSQSMTMSKLSVAVAAAIFAAIGCAGAQTYPSRPITMLVGYAVGGPSDTIARIMADRMKAALGQPVIIENVTGAAGSLAVGARRACRARRLYAGDGRLEHPRRQRRDVRPAIRRGEGLRAGVAAAERAADHPHAELGPGQEPQGTAGLDQGRSRQGELRHVRPRQPVARQRRVAAERHWREIPARAVSRRSAGDDTT